MSAAMLEITVVIVMSEDYSYDVQENVDSAALFEARVLVSI